MHAALPRRMLHKHLGANREFPVVLKVEVAHVNSVFVPAIFLRWPDFIGWAAISFVEDLLEFWSPSPAAWLRANVWGGRLQAML